MPKPTADNNNIDLDSMTPEKKETLGIVIDQAFIDTRRVLTTAQNERRSDLKSPIIENLEMTNEEYTEELNFHHSIAQLAKSIEKLQNANHAEFVSEDFKFNADEGVRNTLLMKEFADAILANTTEILRSAYLIQYGKKDFTKELNDTAKLMDGVIAVYKNPKDVTALQKLLENNSKFEAKLEKIADTKVQSETTRYEYSEIGKKYILQQRLKALASTIYGFIGVTLIVVGALGLLPTFGASAALVAIGALALSFAAALQVLKEENEISRPTPEKMGKQVTSPATTEAGKRAISEAKEILKLANSGKTKSWSFLGGNKKVVPDKKAEHAPELDADNSKKPGASK